MTQVFAHILLLLALALPVSAQEIRGHVVRMHDGKVFIDLHNGTAVRSGERYQILGGTASNGEIDPGASLVGTVEIREGSRRFARGEMVELGPGMSQSVMTVVGRDGLWVVAFEQDEADDALVERPKALSNVEGRVREVSGDLVYVEGMNGAVPMWSRLATTDDNGFGEDLEVIKELDDLIVARTTSSERASYRPADRLSHVGLGNGSKRKARRTVYAARVEEGPVLDGELDDPVWTSARPIEGFLQRDPNYWVPSDEKTVARIIYDDENLYFGFDCPIPDGSGSVAKNMRRDSELTSDDNIQILLDTFNDRQNGFFFFVNPLGAQADYLLSNEGRTYNRDWDCNWTCKTVRKQDRWTAEVQIPFSQLRFKPGDEMVWGINLSRFIANKNEASQLVVGVQSSSPTERYLMMDIGELKGLRQVNARRPIQIKPYVLPGSSKDFTVTDPSENSSFDTGLDLRYGITSNIGLDVSYKTDFAQVEGDQEQTNLTQFSLFFPEKREFFLEGANLFEFGEAARFRGSGTEPPTLLFYSRRIGLEEKRKVPIQVGAKIAGKEGRTSIGALTVLTDPISFEDDSDSIHVRRTNYSVLRVKRDLFARSNVGFIMVNKQIDGTLDGWNTYNRAAGIDFSYSPTSKLNFQGFAARTWDSNIEGTGDAGFFFLNYRGGKFWSRLKYLDVEENFEPAVGFINRRDDLPGFRRYNVYLRWRPRPSFANVRYMSIGPELELFADRANNVKYWTGEASWYTLFNNGDAWSTQLTRFYDVVTEQFAPSDRQSDVIIPPGTYKFTTFRTGPRPSGKRWIVPRFSFEAGTYYTGKRYTFRSQSEFRPTGRASFEVDYRGNWIRLPQANLSIHTLSTRFLYSITTNFFVKVFSQWNNDDETVGTNFLLNWQYRPGSDIFLVFDSGYDTADDPINGGGFKLTQRSRSVLLKLSYQLDL
tara:strand:- start:5555 stop:8365 length:2811 start_codon:yes stop_codon:yes gene_type:complete